VDRHQVIKLDPIIWKIAKAPGSPGSAASQKHPLEISLLGFQNTIPAISNLAESGNNFESKTISKSAEFLSTTKMFNSYAKFWMQKVVVRAVNIIMI